MSVPSHPAKFGEDILAAIAPHVSGRVLDPFAGTGRIHRLASKPGVTLTVGVEIEPEWAAAHPRTIVGNALALPFRSSTFDVIATSPCYGNRLADHHNAQDGSRRHSYTHDLGRTLHPDSAGAIAFGQRYRLFHLSAWAEAKRVLRPGGLMVVNVSDFIRDHQRVAVVTFHRLALVRLGMTLLDEVEVPKVGLRHGANRERVETESVLVLSYGPPKRPPRKRATRKAAPPPPQLEGQLSIFDALGALDVTA